MKARGERREGDALHLALDQLLYGDGLWRIRGRSSQLKDVAYLLDLVATESVLEDLEVGDELVLVLGVHLDTGHWYVACSPQSSPDTVTNPPSQGA